MISRSPLPLSPRFSPLLSRGIFSAARNTVWVRERRRRNTGRHKVPISDVISRLTFKAGNFVNTSHEVCMVRAAQERPRSTFHHTDAARGPGTDQSFLDTPGFEISYLCDRREEREPSDNDWPGEINARRVPAPFPLRRLIDGVVITMMRQCRGCRRIIPRPVEGTASGDVTELLAKYLPTTDTRS